MKFRNDIPFDKLTRLYIAFAWIRNGLLTYNDMSNTPTDQQRIAALVGACREKNPAAQIYISSGYDDGSMYMQAALNPGAFAASVVAFLQANTLDGYDMDWENGLDKDALNTLLAAVRNALDAASEADGKSYGLTLAVWPNVQPEYDMGTIGKTVDGINIMSYGARRSLQPIAENYYAAGLPWSKMIGGIDTEPGYREGGTDTLGPSGTIAQKAAYAQQRGLAGMMSWRLDNDYTVNRISTYQGAIQLYHCMAGRAAERGEAAP